MIDKKAVIAPGAKLADDVSVGPYAVVGEHVEIGSGTTVGPHAVIDGNTKIGKNNQIFQFASIGAIPQDKKFHGETTYLEIGDGNTFREFCTVHLGTEQGGGVTKIGNKNLIMNYVHVGHDCIVGNEVVLSNYAALAGHAIVEDYVIFGGFAKVAQFTHLGTHSFLVANSDVGKDVLPFVIVAGNVDTCKSYGLNLVGLRRHGFSAETIKILKDAYNIVLRKHLKLDEAVHELQPLVAKCAEVQHFIDIIQQSKRGILR